MKEIFEKILIYGAIIVIILTVIFTILNNIFNITIYECTTLNDEIIYSISIHNYKNGSLTARDIKKNTTYQIKNYRLLAIEEREQFLQNQEL